MGRNTAFVQHFNKLLQQPGAVRKYYKALTQHRPSTGMQLQWPIHVHLLLVCICLSEAMHTIDSMNTVTTCTTCVNKVHVLNCYIPSLNAAFNMDDLLCLEKGNACEAQTAFLHMICKPQDCSLYCCM